MDSYVTGTAIRQLREAKHLTQAADTIFQALIYMKVKKILHL